MNVFSFARFLMGGPCFARFLMGGSCFGSGGNSGTPTPTPTPTPIISLGAGSFEVTNPEVGTTWQWYLQSDDSAISGATSTSLATSLISVGEGAYAVPDGDSARRSNTLYNIPAVPDPVVTHYASSGQTNGNTLVTYGWTAFNKANVITVQGGLWCFTTNYYNEGGWKKDVSSPDHALKIVHAYVDDTSSTKNAFDIRARWTDANNYVSLSGSWISGNGYSLAKKIAGVSTTLTPGTYTQHFSGHADNCTIELVVRGGTAYIYENGTLKASDPANSYSTPDGGYNISGVPSANYVVVQQLGGDSTALGAAVAHDIITTSYPASAISLTSATFTAPLLASNFIKLEAVGTAAGSFTMSLGWYDENGQPLYVTTGLTVSSGAFDVSSIPTPHILRGQPATLMFWKASDPTVFGYSALPKIPAYQLVPNTLFGINANTWGSISGDYLRDRGQLADWRDSTNGSNITYNAAGWPIDTPNVGSKYSVLPWQSDISHRSGQYQITWPANVTCAVASSVGVTVDSINNTTHTGLVTLPDTTSLVQLMLDLTPTGSVPGGIVLTCLPVGDAHPTYPVTDQFISDYGISNGWRIVRFMKQLGTEMGAGGDPFVVNRRKYCTPAYVAWLIKNMGVHPWLSFAIAETQSSISTFLTDLKAALVTLGGIPAGLQIYVEWGNELVWNFNYQQQDHRLHWMAANEGYVPGITAPEQGNVIYTFGSKTTTQAFEAGNVIYFAPAEGGYRVCRALQHVNAGADMPLSAANNDANFEFVALVTSSQCRKIQGAKQAWLSGIAKPIFDAGIVKSTLGCFLNDAAADVWERMSSNMVWKAVDVFAPSGYLSQLVTFGSKSFDADYATSGTYNPAVITYLTTDTGDGVPGTMTKLTNLKHGVEALVVASPDYTPGDATPVIGTYEIGCHFGYLSNPADATILTARWNEIPKMTTWGDMWTTYGNRLVNEIGGPHCWFVDVEKHPSHWSTQWQNFGVLDNYVGANPTDQKMWIALSTIALAQP